MKERLKAPATYSRADYKVSELGGSYTFKIEYDAQNAFGANIRGSATCDTYPKKNGQSPSIHITQMD